MDTRDELEFDEGFEAIKKEIKEKERKRGFILASIPAAAVALMWIIIILANIIAASSRSSSKFKVNAGSLVSGYVQGIEVYEFEVDIENTSKHDVAHIELGFSFYDESKGEKIGYAEASLDSNIPAKGSISQKLYLQRVGQGKELWSYLHSQKAHVSEITIEAEVKSIVFFDEKSVDYTESWFGFGYIALLIISVGAVAGWTAHVFLNTYCRKCRSVLSVKTKGCREVSREHGSWTEERNVKDKKGNVVMKYDERVSGDIVTYEYKRVCKCCGNVTYRRATERHKA